MLNELAGSATAESHDDFLERRDEGFVEGGQDLVSNGVFDVVELHELTDGDVVLMEVLVDLMLGDPLAIDGLDEERRLYPLLLMEGLEFGVGLDDCHPRAASVGERAVDGGEIIKQF